MRYESRKFPCLSRNALNMTPGRKAAQYGAVHVIDVEQHSLSKIIVWGTVGEGQQRQSFQCDFGTKMTGFKLRPITPRR